MHTFNEKIFDMTVNICFPSKHIKARDQNQKWAEILIVNIVCIPVFISGALHSWPSPSILKLMSNDSHIPMTFEETSYFSVINPIAIIVSCPFCEYLLDTLGRKRHMMLAFIPQFTSWMTVAFAVNSIMLYTSRALGGIGDTILLTTVPVYVAEVSEKRLRGYLGSLSTLFYLMGQIMMNAIGYYFTIRTAAFIVSSFSIIHLVLFVWMPESPYWLIQKNRLEEAKRELQILRWRSNVDEEFDEIEQAVARQMSETGSYRDVFVNKTNRKAFLITVVTRFTQQYSGIFAYMTYLQYIFYEAGGEIPGHVSSIICLTLLLLGAFAGSRLIDRVGRKPLLLISCYGCIFTLALQTVYFIIQQRVDTSVVSWLPLAIMLAYIALYSVGLCIIPAILIGEFFSASIKPKAVLLMVEIYAANIMISSKIFQLLADHVGLYASYCFFLVSTICLTVVITFIFIETKNKTLEEIQEDLRRSIN